MTNLYEPVRKRRNKGKNWTLVLLLYILITTLLLLKFRDALRFLCYFNPFMFIHFSFEYLSYTMATPALFPGAVVAILILSILPMIGWLLLRLRFSPGKLAIQLAEVVTIFCNSILLIYMFYTSSAINVMLTFPTYILLPLPSIVVPALVLYALKCWNSKQWIKDEGKNRRANETRE